MDNLSKPSFVKSSPSTRWNSRRLQLLFNFQTKLKTKLSINILHDFILEGLIQVRYSIFNSLQFWNYCLSFDFSLSNGNREFILASKLASLLACSLVYALGYSLGYSSTSSLTGLLTRLLTRITIKIIPSHPFTPHPNLQLEGLKTIDSFKRNAHDYGRVAYCRTYITNYYKTAV